VNLRQASYALRSQFFICGVLFATWGVHVPTVKAHYGLDERELAGAMLAAGIGSLAALSQAGRAVAKLGPRGVSLLTGPACCVAVALLIQSSHVAVLFALMGAFGALISLLDVAVNAEASEIERQTGAHVMSGFHGMFSLGGMFGAGLGSAANALGFTPQQHLLMAAGIGLPMLVVGAFFMLPVESQPEETHRGSRIPRGALLLIGVLAALGLVTEGAMYDWSVLYMKQERASDTATAALAYAAFSAAMAGGRFCGDWVRARWSPITVMRWSGALAAVGMALVLALPWPMASLLTFAIVGLGLANVVPVLFSAASKLPAVPPAHAIAAVSSVGWLGMMAGPPMIGFIAQASSLTAGLIVVVVFAAVMALAARHALAGAHQAR